jgi:hypothetical protein
VSTDTAPLRSFEATKTLLPGMPALAALMPQPTHPPLPNVARNASSTVPFAAWYIQCRLAPSTGRVLHLWLRVRLILLIRFGKYGHTVNTV